MEDKKRKHLKISGFRLLKVVKTQSEAERIASHYFKRGMESVWIRGASEGTFEVWIREERYKMMNELFKLKKKKLEKILDCDPQKGVIRINVDDRSET